MIAELADALLETTLASSAAALLVLALRRPLMARFGAGVVYASWGLVPVAWLAVLLPAPELAVAPVALAARVGTLSPRLAMQYHAPLPWRECVLALWALGASLSIALLWRQQRRFQRLLADSTLRADGLRVARATEGLPAVVGVLRPRIVLPADFERRYDAAERELILCHERIHVRRRDLQANAVAAALQALYWFNPLLRHAVQRFRRDQELACDERVIARHPRHRRRYADAMLKTHMAVSPLPLGCHWQAATPLKERIEMLKRHARKPARPFAGAAAVALLFAAGGYAAWAAQPARQAAATPPTRIPVAWERLPPPRYPPDAAKQGVGGDVAVIVDVAADGSVAGARIDKAEPQGVFDDAVLEAVKKWKFTPAYRDGKPVPGRVRVPVSFRTDDEAPRKPAPPSAGAADRSEPVVLSEFPAATPAAGRGINGKVTLAVDVDAEGSVSGAAVQASEPRGVFDAEALKAVRKYKYRPAYRDGRAVAGRTQETFFWDVSMKEAPAPAGRGDGDRYDWFTLDTRRSRIVPQGNCDVVLPGAEDRLVTCGRRRQALQ